MVDPENFDTFLFLKCKSAKRMGNYIKINESYDKKKRVQKVTLKNLKCMQAASSTDLQLAFYLKVALEIDLHLSSVLFI